VIGGVARGPAGTPIGMSDVNRDANSEPDEDAPTPVERERPEEQAHGGSMAPGLVDPTGHPTGDVPPAVPADPED
jgi:hypothetical protein